MEIFATAVSRVDNSVNGQGTRTLSAIESEVPTFAAVTAAVNSQCTRPVNMKSSIRKVFCKDTVLSKMEIKEI